MHPPDQQTDSLFSQDLPALQTPLLDVDILDVTTMTLNAFANYRTIRILTYSTSPHILKELFELAPNSTVECILGSNRTISNLADLFLAQSLIQDGLRHTFTSFPEPTRSTIVDRIQRGQLAFRILNGQASHAKIFLLSDGDTGDHCAFLGSANFSSNALIGDQHEVIIRTRSNYGWDVCEQQYFAARQHSSQTPTSTFDTHDAPDSKAAAFLIPVPAILQSDEAVATATIQLSLPQSTPTPNDAFQHLQDILLQQLPKHLTKPTQPTIHLDKNQRRRFTGIIRKAAASQPPSNPTFSLNPDTCEATLNGVPWPLDTKDDDVAHDTDMLLSYWQTYQHHFQGNTARLQHDYFVFLSWLFFAPFVATVRRRLTLQRLDPIQVPRFGILYGQSNSGKTLLLQTVSRFMFGDAAPTPLRANRITAGEIHAIDRSYRRMPAILDDLGPRRFTNHVHDIVKDETAPPSDEHPCFAISMNAELNAFIPEITKRTLLLYSTASFPANREQSRISMANQLASIEPTTSLYRRYLTLIVDHIPRHAEDLATFDWLKLSSSTLSGLLSQHATLPAWASPTLWAQHANARFDHISAQLDTLLDPASRQPSRAKVTANSWYASKHRIHLGLMLDSFGRPTFDWKTLPSNLVVNNESTPDKLVLDRHETETFIGRDVIPSKWLRLFRSS